MEQTPKKELTLFDSTCLIVGIIIGAGIYETAPTVAASVNHAWGIFVLWIVGGLLSLAGALCYAELASAYPREGGDYVYLTRAYGRWAGFLFGWIQLIIVRPGDIALMAFIFARYAKQLYNPLAQNTDWFSQHAMYLIYACAAVILLSLINIIGVRQGKWTQNFLTVVKTLGLALIVFVGLTEPAAAPAAVAQTAAWQPPLSLAMILILFTYGGWNEMAYVAAEVKDPKRNILRALVVGTIAVIVLYLLANAAFLRSLGHAGMAGTEAIAVDTIRGRFGDFGPRIIAIIICISALGAVNGLIFAGARISYALGKDHRLFNALGQWHGQRSTPVPALILQTILALILIVAFGSFERTILYTAAAVYMFYMATSLSVIVLRRREPDVERPFRVTGYPFTPILFAGVCAFLIYSGAIYKPKEAGISLAILGLGVAVYFLSRRR
ncbi:MAG: amino acid permease [Phycisphaerae bacterium]|nr:amino acid permease [Phycisphaerae bacterium]